MSPRAAKPAEAPAATPGEIIEAPAMLVPASPTQQQAVQVLSMLERVLLAPEFDIDRAERLWAMQKEILAQQAKASFIAASSVMQGQIPSIPRRGQIKNNSGQVQSTYALWEDVNDKVKPVLREHGFSLSFVVNQADKAITVTGILSHRDGHQETTEITLAPDKTGAKNDVQSVGSSISYGKRYTASALLNITSHGEDDDGRAAGDAERTDENMAKVADFETAILEAIDEVELSRVGADIARADFPPRLRTRVRRCYGARLTEIRNGVVRRPATSSSGEEE